ncbi:hypothetical protein RJT34_21566 [Clitoria ternatea]|uniref:Uncharacterized protein n=1 Tax=Clitoria ternatea TaxID=43366 RepID=A0AAN9IUQ5_CLITE
MPPFSLSLSPLTTILLPSLRLSRSVLPLSLILAAKERSLSSDPLHYVSALCHPRNSHLRSPQSPSRLCPRLL